MPLASSIRTRVCRALARSPADDEASASMRTFEALVASKATAYPSLPGTAAQCRRVNHLTRHTERHVCRHMSLIRYGCAVVTGLLMPPIPSTECHECRDDFRLPPS